LGAFIFFADLAPGPEADDGALDDVLEAGFVALKGAAEVAVLAGQFEKR
jgi:hypothetical protein